MAERLDLTAAVTYPSTTYWRVARLDLNWNQASITIDLVGPNNERKSHQYIGATATTLMVALNKANLTSNSLQKRVLDRLVSDGVLAGTVSGSPD